MIHKREINIKKYDSVSLFVDNKEYQGLYLHGNVEGFNWDRRNGYYVQVEIFQKYNEPILCVSNLDADSVQIVFSRILLTEKINYDRKKRF